MTQYPQNGSAQAAKQIEQIMQANPGITREQAAAALAKSQQMAEVDPAAVIAEQAAEDALLLRQVFMARTKEAASAQNGGAKQITEKQFLAALDPEGLLRVIEASTNAAQAVAAMREEQRKEVIWAEQSEAIHRVEAELTKRADQNSEGFGFSRALNQPASPPKQAEPKKTIGKSAQPK